MHLPIKDAVRMSILSTRWRNKWVSIPDLVFDKDCVEDDKTGMKLVNIVGQVLLQHVGPIHKFMCQFNVQRCGHINHWIGFLSRNGIKQLILSGPEINEPYDVPSYLFQCQELRFLKLHCCVLRVPLSLKGLYWLMDLQLQAVEITEDALESLTSKCPLLERLTITEFYFTDLKINAPNIRYLNLKGAFADLSVRSCSLLTDVYIDLNDDLNFDFSAEHPEQGESCNLTKFLGPLHGIERLEMKQYFSTFLCVGRVPEKLCTTYDHLKHLCIDVDVHIIKEILLLLCICRSSPNLEKLKIKWFWDDEEENDVWDARDSLDCSFNHLRVVEMIEPSGKLFDMELIRYILSSAPVLERLSFTLDQVPYDKKLSILKKLARFQRASAQAELVYM